MKTCRYPGQQTIPNRGGRAAENFRLYLTAMAPGRQSEARIAVRRITGDEFRQLAIVDNRLESLPQFISELCYHGESRAYCGQRGGFHRF